MLNTVVVPERFCINSLGQICSLSGSWFWICCSFFTIWIFNIYSWIVSAVLCSDGVLSVPATKAFPKSQNLGNFPCKFLFAHFHAVNTEATKAATLWLCFVWHLIPHPVWHMVTQLGDKHMPLPFFPLQNVHLLCRGHEDFPRTARDGMHGMSLVSSHTWILH